MIVECLGWGVKLFHGVYRFIRSDVDMTDEAFER